MTPGVLSTAQSTTVVVCHVLVMKDVCRWKRVLSQAPRKTLIFEGTWTGHKEDHSFFASPLFDLPTFSNKTRLVINIL
jgi:hypothetical protein